MKLDLINCLGPFALYCTVWCCTYLFSSSLPSTSSEKSIALVWLKVFSSLIFSSLSDVLISSNLSNFLRQFTGSRRQERSRAGRSPGRTNEDQDIIVRHSYLVSWGKVSTVQYSTVQYSTVQYSTVQVQYSTVQYSTVQ